MLPTLELVLRVAAAAQLLLLAGVLFKSLRPALIGTLLPLLALGIAAYLLCPLVAHDWDLGPLKYVVFFLCFANPVLFWLASRAIFDDRFRLHPGHGVMLIVVVGAGFWHRWSRDVAAGDLFGIDQVEASRLAHQFPALAIIVVALVLAFRGRGADLVEPRRRFRDILVGGAGGYMVLVIATEIFLQDRRAWPEIELLNVAAIFALTMAVSLFLLRLHKAAFPLIGQPLAAPEAQNGADKDLLAAIEGFIADGGYRQEGLTIGALAKRLGTQEYKLRRLINRHLGYRNFNDFLNHHRIDAAKAAFSDPEFDKLPILTIAMDLGYRSLGPFNRAFKEATGITPSEFRRSRNST